MTKPQTLIFGAVAGWITPVVERCEGSGYGPVAVLPEGVCARALLHEEIERLCGGECPERLVISPAIAEVSAVGEEVFDQLELLLQRNTLAAIYALESLVPRFIERKSGHILAIVPACVRRPSPESSAFGAAGVALSVYLESLRPPLGLRGVKVTIGYVGGDPPWSTASIGNEDIADGVLAALGKRPLEFELPKSRGWRKRRRATVDRPSSLTFG